MSIVPHQLPITEAKIYKTKKNRNKQLGDEELAMRELETILSSKNRRPCDCEAQEHDLVANCLGCGRIVCTSEGSGNCLTCGNLVLNKDQKSRLQEHINLIPGTSSASSRSAKQEKNFRVIDDQFNYFSMADQKWLTDVDKQKLRLEMDELQAAKYRKKLILNVDLDNLTGGAESVPEIDDFEERVRKLQLKSEQLSGGSCEAKQIMLLREIVAYEATKDFNFTYMSQEDRDGTTKNNSKNQTKAKKARSNKSTKVKQSKINDSATASNKSSTSNPPKAGPNNKPGTSKGNDSKVNSTKNKNEKIITKTKLPNVKKKSQQTNPAPVIVKNAWEDNVKRQQK